MTIAADDYVRVPKGTTVWTTDAWTEPKRTTRDMIVQVKRVDTVVSNCWLFLPRDLYQRENQKLYDRYGSRARGIPENQTAFWQPIIEANLIDVVPGSTPMMVEWSNRCTFLHLVEKAEPPKPKPVVVKKIAQFVPKSVWRFTQDCDVRYEWFSNPGAKRNEPKPLCRIKAGTTIEQVGKTQSHMYMRADTYNGHSLTGTYFPFRVVSGEIEHFDRATHWYHVDPGATVWLPYKEIEGSVEAESVPEVSVFVLRDNATGLYLREVSPAHKYGWGKGERDKVEPLTMTDSYGKALKLKDMNHVRLNVMGWTGYYAGMDLGAPDWVGSGDKVADLPPTFEAVEFDKLNKTERRVHDLQAWNTRLWKLRSLTLDYGSVVRKLYNDLDKKGLIEEFGHILAMRSPHKHDELTPEQIKPFEDMVAQANVAKKDIRRAKDPFSMAVAFRDANSAFLMRMLYAGDIPMAVLNMRTMQEEVRAKDGN